MQPQSFQKNRSGRLTKSADGFWAFAPNPLPPEISLDWDLVSLLSSADRSLSELAGTARTLRNPHLLIAPFTRREAVLSSRIEGTVASLSDLYSFEALGFATNDREDVKEVSNYVTALEYGLKRIEQLPLSLRLIRELHERLMAGVRGHNLTPGEFRRSQNWIGPPGTLLKDATFVPPPVPEMKDCLDAFERYLHASSQLPPLIRFALVHYQFEAIHPFLDGNGRIGRLLITLLLVAEKLLPQPLLYLSAYFEARRDEYYHLLLAVSQRGAWEEWVRFFLVGVAEQSQDALRRATRLQELAERYRSKLHGARANSALMQISESLFERPVVTPSSISSGLHITYAAAQRNVDKLLKLRILEEVTGRQRNRVYVASEIVRTVEEVHEEP